MFRIACLVIGYFIGCIQTAYFVGKAYHVDISKVGSGNLGTTNTVRALGAKVGLFTFWCDVAKSLVAFLICKAIFKADPIVAGFYGSAGAILGHDFPFFHKFKGCHMAVPCTYYIYYCTSYIAFGLCFGYIIDIVCTYTDIFTYLGLPFRSDMGDDSTYVSGNIPAQSEHKTSVERN